MPSLVEMLGGQLPVQPQGAAAQSLMRPAFDEDAFQRDIRATEWFKELAAEHGEPNLDIDEYDYRKAWAAGVRPERSTTHINPKTGLGYYHWGSSNPETGEMFKADDHPTAWKEHFMRKYQVDPDTLSDDQLWEAMALGERIPF